MEKLNLSSDGKGIIFLVIFFLVAGLFMIFSASALIAYSYNEGDTFYFFKRQFIWIIIGLILAYFIYKNDLSKIKKYSFVALGISFILQLILLPEALLGIDLPFVKTLNGATRWIDLVFFDLQPSELIKISLVIFLSSWFAMSNKEKLSIEKKISKYKGKELLHSFLFLSYKIFPLILLGLTAIFIMAQKDLDTIIIIALPILVIYYVSDRSFRNSVLTTVFLLISIIGGGLAIFGEGYRRERFLAYLEILLKGEPSREFRLGGGFQVWNILVALGSGGIWGVGYGESRQKLFFLQEAAYTDSIFAIIGEEFGLLGCLAVILGFLLFLSMGMKIARRASDKFSSILAVGLTNLIVIQAFLNIAANLSLIPFGGMPLPFFSYGGSHIIITLISVGLLLNIDKNRSYQKIPPGRFIKL